MNSSSTTPDTPTARPEDTRAWTQTLKGLGPLSYLPKDAPASSEVLGTLGTITALDSEKAILAVGARAGRGLGIFAGIFFIFSSAFMAAMSIGLGLLKGDQFGFLGMGTMAILMMIFGSIFISADLNRVAETLVLLNRQTRQIVCADPTARVKRVRDIRFRTWSWDDCDFAIERVIMSATAAQTFHLRAVRRNAQGEPEQTALLAAMIPSIDHALALYEFLRRYMARDDAHLPECVRLVPAGRLTFFEACKQSFITYLIEVGEDGLPRWPRPLVALFYAVLAIGLVIAFPFVLGKVIAEWSSQEMRFPDGAVPTNGQPLPGVRIIPARQAVFAPWEKAYYLGCMATGLVAWTFWIRHVVQVFSA
ncbi:hypothetical protein KGA65_20465 [Ideonella sp. B7]|uniref:hypothetical protein n=1 Tax=Ideonella benzenivorans TaxID=2831643 RepID=UPI001CED249B|nr:hypothetical protein [Ideonella benzenivorans]MCA6218924.1 hypothetical protein [Ideonella benzenivorans]